MIQKKLIFNPSFTPKFERIDAEVSICILLSVNLFIFVQITKALNTYTTI